VKKKVLCINTGGTILMKKGASGINISKKNDSIQVNNKVDKNIKVDTLSLSNIPSPYITEKNMMDIVKCIQINEKKYDGFIVLHGTDTVEETSFYVDLFLKTKKPVVFTMAMRSQNENGYDGSRNLCSAIQVCIDKQAKNRKTMLVINDKIYCSHEAEKKSSMSVDAFTSGDYGILGYIDNEKVKFHRENEKSLYLTSTIETDFKIAIIKCHTGCDDTLLQSCISNGVKGIVIEAFGKGNVPLAMVEGIKVALKKGIHILISTRVRQGGVSPSYSYEGGAASLEKLGCVLTGDLKSEKARLLLMALLKNKKSSKQKIKKAFKEIRD
jgi:L-asparaginase